MDPFYQLLTSLVELGNDPDIVCIKVGNTPVVATPDDKTPTQDAIPIEPQNQSADVESQSDDDTEETIGKSYLL